MIVIEKPMLKFLLAGRTVDVPVTREYRRGRVYAVGVHHKRSICHAIILNANETSEGWTLTIRQQMEDKPVFLAANPGAIRADYTTNPARAARELDGSPIEAVDSTDRVWLAKQAAQASERDDAARREDAHRRRLERRGGNTSALQVQWSVAPPASDIQAAVSVGSATTRPLA